MGIGSEVVRNVSICGLLIIPENNLKCKNTNHVLLRVLRRRDEFKLGARERERIRCPSAFGIHIEFVLVTIYAELVAARVFNDLGSMKCMKNSDMHIKRVHILVSVIVLY